MIIAKSSHFNEDKRQFDGFIFITVDYLDIDMEETIGFKRRKKKTAMNMNDDHIKFCRIPQKCL